MRRYRFLTGADDAAFCERVERLLNKGWQLHGGPTLTFNGNGVTAGQALVQETDGEYSGFVHLDDLYPQK